ncbi:sulfatase family protein [Dyadobacter jejuensis]|nr:sulfatase [Dyadobacter jejuensis]
MIHPKLSIKKGLYQLWARLIPSRQLAACCWIGLLASLPGYSQQAPESPPNIIFIIADDVNWDDIGAYGNKKVKTPHLDQLASGGMIFNNMFLTASSCSPSRTSILTGRYPHNTGAAELHTPLPEHLTFFPERLKENGYFTALAGKWHEGPATRRAYDTLLVNKKANGEGGEGQWLNLLQNRPKQKPFFFWFSSFDAHRPWSSQTEGYQHRYDKDIEVPENLLDSEATRKDLALYYNEIGRLDHYVGQIVQELEKQGITENTLIVFMSDNGRPFPGSKTRLYDTGLKTPFIVKWPRMVKTGQSCQSLVSSVDLAATFLDLASIAKPTTVQGVSFKKLLTNPSADFRDYAFGEHNWHDYSAYERSVRTKEGYLYLINKRPTLTNGGPIDANQSPAANDLKSANNLNAYQKDVFLQPRATEEFFDGSKDPLNKINLIGKKEYRTQIDRLRSVMKQWQMETGDTVPDQLTPDWYDRETGKPLPAKGTRGQMPGAALNASKINQPGPF